MPENSNIQFDNSTDEFAAPRGNVASGNDFSSKLINWGLVSTRDEAQYVLIGIAVLATIAAFFVYRSSSGGTSAPPPAAVQMQMETQMPGANNGL